MKRISKQEGYYGFEALSLITPILFTLVLGFSVLELGYLASKVSSKFLGPTVWIENPENVLNSDIKRVAFHNSTSFEFDSLGFPIKRAGVGAIEWTDRSLRPR